MKKQTYVYPGTSMGVQWLRLHASTVGDTAGSIPGQGTKIWHAVWHGQKFKNRQTKVSYDVFNFLNLFE